MPVPSRFRVIARFVVLALVALTASACTSDTAADPQGKADGRTLVWAWNFAPTAKWALETDDASYLTQAGVAEPLVRVGISGALEPGLATSWERVDDLNWKFTLRPGVKFQNGDVFNADAVVKALDYVLHVKVPGPAVNPDVITGVAADGSDAVVITTAKPNALIPQQLSAAGASIMAAEAYKGDGSINPMGTGTGPFIMTAINLPQSISLKANPDYWGGSVGMARAEVRYVTDGQTRLSLARTGEAQLVSTIPATQLETVASDNKLTTTSEPSPRFTALYLNNKAAPFSDERARQGVQAAIDLASLAQAIGGAQPASGPFNASDPWAPQTAPASTYDLDKARNLLDAAGLTPGTQLRLMAYTDRAELPAAATIVQEMLAKVGLKVKIRTGTYNALEPDMLSGNYDMALTSRGYLFDSPDPYSFLTSDYTCKGTYNISAYCDPQVDQELDAAAGVTDDAQRYSLYAKVAQTLQDDAVNVFLYHSVQSDVHAKDLDGFGLYLNTEYYLTKDLAWK
jgi:peptide/nickel transport system substrate-binding protein